MEYLTPTYASKISVSNGANSLCACVLGGGVAKGLYSNSYKLKDLLWVST